MKPAKAAIVVTDLSHVQCIGYVRVSTEGQATDDRTSLADQKAAISATAEHRGLEVGAWFVDAGASGATVEKRPQLRALLASCEAHPRHGSRGLVLALNDSRWGRFPDPEEATYWRVHLSKLGWQVRFVEGDDVDDVMGRGVMRFVGQAQASEYRANLQRNTRRGMKGTAERGLWSRREPYGYRRMVTVGRGRVLDPGERKADGERVALVPDEREAAVVRRIFDAYVSGGQSIRSLMRELRRTELGRKWSVRAVALILSNRVYCGDVLSGRRAGAPDQYGKADAHEAIVTRDVFARAQERLAQNRRAPRKPESDWILSGLVTCADCGEPFVAGGLGSRRADGTRARFYADRGGRDDMKGGKRCQGPTGTVTKHLLENAALDTIADVLRSAATQKRIEAAVDRFLSSTGRSVTDDGAAAHREVAKLEKQRERLVEAVKLGTFQPADVRRDMDALRVKIDAANAAVQRVAFRGRQASASKGERDRLVSMASDFAGQLHALPAPELRVLVRPWIASATFDKRSRVLTLTIRRVPAIAPLVLSHSPGLAVQKQDVVIRRVAIGGRR